MKVIERKMREVVLEYKYMYIRDLAVGRSVPEKYLTNIFSSSNKLPQTTGQRTMVICETKVKYFSVQTNQKTVNLFFNYFYYIRQKT